MSKIDYRPKGGMDGLSVTRDELEAFAKLNGFEYIDQYIPLEDYTPERARQESILKSKSGCPINHEDNFDDIFYWEDEKGSHGWCCSVCGKVIQWG